jgi:BON domain
MRLCGVVSHEGLLVGIWCSGTLVSLDPDNVTRHHRLRVIPAMGSRRPAQPDLDVDAVAVGRGPAPQDDVVADADAHLLLPARRPQFERRAGRERVGDVDQALGGLLARQVLLVLELGHGANHLVRPGDLPSQVLRDHEIRARYAGGWLTLKGRLKHQYDSDAAFEAVSGLAGVRGITNEIKVARFPARKPLEEFDFRFQTSIRRDAVQRLGQLDSSAPASPSRLPATRSSAPITPSWSPRPSGSPAAPSSTPSNTSAAGSAPDSSASYSNQVPPKATADRSCPRRRDG